MDSLTRKTASLIRAFPPPNYNTQAGTMLRALLDAFATEDANIVDQIEATKDQLFLDTAFDKFLDMAAANYGVSRPLGFKLNDDIFRQVAKLLANFEKNTSLIFQLMLTAFFIRGSVIEVDPNVIVLKLPWEIPALQRTLPGTTYMHQNPVETNYPSGYIYDSQASVMPTRVTTQLNVPVTAGTIPGVIRVFNAASFPDKPGNIIFSLSGGDQEIVPYTRRLNNSTLSIPGYQFLNSFAQGVTINLGANKTGYPRKSGQDFAFYQTDLLAARDAVIQILQSIKAAGVRLEIINIGAFEQDC